MAEFKNGNLTLCASFLDVFLAQARPLVSFICIALSFNRVDGRIQARNCRVSEFWKRRLPVSDFILSRVMTKHCGKTGWQRRCQVRRGRGSVPPSLCFLTPGAFGMDSIRDTEDKVPVFEKHGFVMRWAGT